ncbi:hypothetical protein HanIR_Chr11g0509981 [Helianthus annuus]|nr:hypothetical protein HanIR_Chr11g0509981 [Helianthus annuus]
MFNLRWTIGVHCCTVLVELSIILTLNSSDLLLIQHLMVQTSYWFST